MEEQIRRLEERIQREPYRQEELIREWQNLQRRNFNSNYMLRTLSDYVTLLRDHFRTTENPMTGLPSMRRRFNDMLVVCECCSITLSRFRSTPWQIIDFRFRITFTVPLPHLQRTPVGIRGRRRTQLASRPQERRQVIRAQTAEQIPPDESDIVRALILCLLLCYMLNSDRPFQGDSSNDPPLNEET